MICLTVLFTTLFGGVVFSKDFRHMVFNTLEGDGKMSVSSVFADQVLSDEELSEIFRPTKLDNSGYSVYMSGDAQDNYTLYYRKQDTQVIFDLRRGMTQAFFDTDHMEWEAYTLNGNPAYLSFTEGNGTIDIFMQDGISCSISGPFDKEQLIDLAYSISFR